MEADTEIYSKALGRATWDQSKRERESDDMSKEVKTMTVIPTETTDLS